MRSYILRLPSAAGCCRGGGAGGQAARGRLAQTLSACASAQSYSYIDGADEFIALAEKGLLRDSRLIFAVETDSTGIELSACIVLKFLRAQSCESGGRLSASPRPALGDSLSAERPVLGDSLSASAKRPVLDGAVCGVIIDGDSATFTKDLARRLAFSANAAGAVFPGKPLVEATADLRNFKTLAGVWQTDLAGAYVKACDLLLQKVLDFDAVYPERPSILAVHASNRKTSNSLSLWDVTAAHLEGRADVDLISIRNGQLWDCRGCKYEECLHFGENGDCFYGGVMVEKVYPAIIKSDVLVLICPNYNDSVSANMMAFINRLTAVFRAKDFSRKRVYAIIVSGYSGGDIVAQQVIGAINMNKNLILPARFALLATANDPGEAAALPGIDSLTADFAERILSPARPER